MTLFHEDAPTRSARPVSLTIGEEWTSHVHLDGFGDVTPWLRCRSIGAEPDRCLGVLVAAILASVARTYTTGLDRLLHPIKSRYEHDPARSSLSEPNQFTDSTVTKDRKQPRRGGPPRLQDTVRLSADGLAKVLGDLEARVMRTVWALGKPSTARTVHDRVIEEHEVALLTVITVLNKLVTKGLLARAKRDDVYHYAARLTEAELRSHASRRVVDGILSLGPEAVAASLVDALAKHDPAQLAELGRLVRRKLKGMEDS